MIEGFISISERQNVRARADPQLKEFVEQVNAKNVIPVYTQNAKAFEKWAKNVTLLTNVGDSFTI